MCLGTGGFALGVENWCAGALVGMRLRGDRACLAVGRDVVRNR